MKEEKIIAFLKDRMITQDEAIKILEDNLPFRTTWKMWRFTLYLWRRIDEQKRGVKDRTRIASVMRLVMQKNYKNLYDTFPLPAFNSKKEVANLTQLISEPRQDKAFKEGNFVYEGTNKNISQAVIDRLR